MGYTDNGYSVASFSITKSAGDLLLYDIPHTCTIPVSVVRSALARISQHVQTWTDICSVRLHYIPAGVHVASVDRY